MNILGIKLGKSKNPANQNATTTDKAKTGLIDQLKHNLKKLQRLAGHYQVTIIALAVAGLLAVTTLRMLHYMNPPTDDNLVQQNLAKYQKTRIDPKIVQKINQLQDSGTSTNPNIESSRTNPFSE